MYIHSLHSLGFPPRFSGPSTYRNDTLSVCKVCDVTISEMVEFLSTDRVHMQQGIFPDVQQSYLLHSQVAFDEVSCKVLVGAPLKQNEFLKIDQTCFVDIITEEVGNEQLRQGSPQEKKQEGAGRKEVGGDGGKAVTFAGEMKATEDSPDQQEGEVALPLATM